MKFNDPSGYYSNDEIMQHFGCNDWACVEAYFQEGGAYAGLWGWLYILQMAQNGDAVTAYGAGARGMAVQATLGGVFQRSAAGQIEIVANFYESSATGLHRVNAVVPEGGFATLAKAYDYGHYTLSGSANIVTGRNDPKNYFHFDPSKVDKGGLVLAGLKAGADFGPVIMERAASCPDPACAGAVFTLGFSYMVVGYTTVLVADVIIPVTHAFTSGDTGPAWESIAVEATSRLAGKADRFVYPAYDIAKTALLATGAAQPTPALWPGQSDRRLVAPPAAPRYWALDLPADAQAWRRGRKRFWIEPTVRDWKSYGFDLEHSQIVDADRLQVLVLGMAVTTLWMMHSVIGCARRAMPTGSNGPPSLTTVSFAWGATISSAPKPWAGRCPLASPSVTPDGSFPPGQTLHAPARS